MCSESGANHLNQSATNPRATTGIFVLILSFFLLSGGAGLLYQVVWTRKLVLLFGTTAYAVSTVLAIFFLGLGIGSAWGGRLADHHARPLRLYGVFEIVIGLWAAGFIFLVGHGEHVVAEILQLTHGTRVAGVALRGGLAVVLLLVPVTLMGATLPLLSRFVVHEMNARGWRVGALYTVNTVGAVGGCFVTGFFLIPALGYTLTTLVGVAANAIVGVAALALSARVEHGAEEIAEPHSEPTADSEATFGLYGLLLAVYAVSGFCGLGLEVLWTRLLAIVFLGTTYAYTTMLTALLCGLALGSGVAALLADRVRARLLLLGGALLIAGAGTLWMLGSFASMPGDLAEIQREANGEWSAVIRGKFRLAFVAILPTTFFLGMTFPLVVRAASGAAARLGRDVGRLYFANTIGGVLGSAVAGFLLIPMLGTHLGIVVLALLLLSSGVAVVLAARDESAGRRGAVLALLLLAAFAWRRAPADVNVALNVGYVPSDHRVIHAQEGVEGTVVVSEPRDLSDGRDRVLWINRVQATTSIEKGVKMNRLQGVLPLLYARDPETVLFMCFGSGITCGTLALSDFDRIDAVEISPDVLEAAPLFARDNLGVMDRENVTFHIDDGRNHLLTTDHRYDVITFEPMPMALAGVSTFYTRDYYELCRARLSEDGMVSQWAPLHGSNTTTVQALVRTFVDAFPHCQAWFVNADLFLIGADTPLVLDYAGFEKHWNNPVLREALQQSGFPDVTSLYASFLMDRAGLEAFAGAGPVMMDDRPWAEFVAPRLVHERNVPDALRAVAPHATAPDPYFAESTITAEERALVARRHRSRMNDLKVLPRFYAGFGLGAETMEGFLDSLRIDPNNANARYYLARLVDHQFKQLMAWEDYEALETRLVAVTEVVSDVPRYWQYLERVREARTQE